MKRIHPNHLKDWRVHRDEWLKCNRCPLGAIAQHHVLGRGTIPCDVLMVGEAPGNVEDAQGVPFVGPAGQILQSIIDKAQERVKFEYFITNTVACKPQDRFGGQFRQPSRAEQEKCYPRLWDLMDFCGAKGVVRLGRIAMDRVSVCGGLGFIDMPHPSYVLRNGGEKSDMYGKCVTAMELFCNHLLSTPA